MSEEDSCYSNDEEYFMDLCRAGEIEELADFLKTLPQQSSFNWSWFNHKNDNFMHMLAGNNMHTIFDYILPFLKDRCLPEQIMEITNKKNSTGCTPLHYAVITGSKEMVQRLLSIGADPNISNEQDRTPFEEAAMFQKIQIAEMLAPVTGNNLETLKEQVKDLKLNEDDSSDSEEQPLPEIPEKTQE